MKTDRWNTAIHEAGHAVAAITLGGKCKGLVLVPGGGGVATTSELLGNREVWMVAAGPAAESLAVDYAPPEEPIAETLPKSIDDIEDSPIYESDPFLACYVVRSPETRVQFEIDERKIALWAIGGHEFEPETWAERVRQCHEMAAQIVRHNAATIARIAEQLFTRGCLSESEILGIINTGVQQ